ncbi:MAG TPA: V-type ATPase 116kDa subunit family protein [Candidatus Izemoplasmatales bacterium]|nr:V-type ATPase 116kDa subunit family protein [Candidatus Izemoplasmatales bacterium]
MAIAKINLFNITSSNRNLDQVLEKFVLLDYVHPVIASDIVDKVHGLTSYSTENPCNIILKELEEIEKENGIDLPTIGVNAIDYSLDNMREYIHSTHDHIQRLYNQKKDAQALIKKYSDALDQIKDLENLDISLDDLFACDYINSRVGRIPVDSLEKLNFYNEKAFIFKSLRVGKGYCWCIYLTTNDNEREIDNIFSSLFFERIHIPDFVHGTPVSAQETLNMELDVAQGTLSNIQTEIDQILNKNIDKLKEMKSELLFLERIYEAKKYVVGLGDKFNINGFVEKENIDKLKEHFGRLEDVNIEIRPADSDNRLTPPTKLKNNWFTKPFGMFVEMYGVPGYKDMDPTMVVAITYSLLFGIMFADVGQGLVLAILSFVLYKKTKMSLAGVGIRIGLSSAFFGVFFDSVFGEHGLIAPMFESLGISALPLHAMDPNSTMTLLIGTVALGSLIILISMMINIRTAFKAKHYANALFSPNGIAGFVLYGFVLTAVAFMFLTNIDLLSPLFIIPFAILPLVLILFKEPLERLMEGHKLFPGGFGGFFTEAFFETFETVLSYITNTMSFLRVGGFVLSHAGMMLVVFSLMEMFGPVGATITFIVGNLFVMALEGLIVGIQVLRLEFYEMFSRYFEGNGIPFKYNE